MAGLNSLLPYLRLLDEGSLRKGSGNEEVVKHLLGLRWVIQARQTSRVEITSLGRQSLPTFLDGQWPQWREYLEGLKAGGHPVTIEGVKEYERCRRRLQVSLPAMVHRKTLAATLGMHSKTGLSQQVLAEASSVTPTTDQVLRFRANSGLMLQRGDQYLSCNEPMAFVGEIILPERAFLDELALTGTLPTVVLTVENLGSYVDLPPVGPDFLVLHVPGKDTPLATRFLGLFPETVAHVHFGDLDPEGLEVAGFLDRSIRQKTEVFIPDFWEDYIEHVFTDDQVWPERVYGEEHPLVQRLKKEGKWLEQERIAFDPRLKDALALFCGGGTY